MAPIYNWTGFYVGLNAGGAWNESNVTSTVFSEGGYFADTSPAAIALAGNQNINKFGFTGGVTAGYNWQINNAVLGVETDFNYFGIKGSSTRTAVYPCCVAHTFTVNSSKSTDWLWTLRGRVGFLVTPALLLYGPAAWLLPISRRATSSPIRSPRPANPLRSRPRVMAGRRVWAANTRC